MNTSGSLYLLFYYICLHQRDTILLNKPNAMLLFTGTDVKFLTVFLIRVSIAPKPSSTKALMSPYSMITSLNIRDLIQPEDLRQCWIASFHRDCLP